MIYIENNSHDPHYNLAFEEYVFHNLCRDDTILLLWQNEPSVIIGKHQNTVEEINAAFIESRGVNVVRRITGGGAVYHDLGNLNYSFLIPDVKNDIDFKTFTRPLIDALEKLHVKVEQSGRNDITIEEKKFSGNAQYYFRNVLLHHGTILFESRLEDVQQELKLKPGKIESKGVKSVRSRVTNIRPYLQTPMTIETFKRYLLQAFSEAAPLTVLELTEAQQAGIRQLADTKYRTWDWNYGRSPKCNISRSGYFEGGYVEIHLNVESGQITEAKVFGDFFSTRDTAEFEALLVGAEYSREALAAIVAGADIGRFFNRISEEEILGLLY